MNEHTNLKHSKKRDQASIRSVLRSNAASMTALSLTSMAGGLIEAGFLLVVTRLAFAVTEDSQQLQLMGRLHLPLTAALAVGVLLLLLRIAAGLALGWQAASFTSKLVASTRRSLASAFLGASWKAQHGSQSGRLQELLTTYAQQGSALGSALGGAAASGFSLLALLATAIVVQPVASIVLVLSVLILASILRPVRTAIRTQARSAASVGMEFATSLNEISQLGMEMHVFGVQEQTERKVQTLIEQNESIARRLNFLKSVLPTMYVGLAYFAILGALGAISSIAISDLGSVSAVMLIMLRSLSYGQALQVALASVSGAVPFLSSLDDELSRYREAELPVGQQHVTSARFVSVENVNFGYALDTPVLNDISFNIGPKEIVGIIGPSGGGKSTIVELLLGLRTPDSGTIRIGGQDLHTLRREEWVRKVTLVPQDSHLIEGSVADNIRFLRDWVSDDDIKAACELANLEEDIARWDEGYERQVGSGGSGLSGGQRQRLTIARALVEKPDLLILDEPTSALDVRSESLIRTTLNNLRHETTVVIVAHRLSTLDICDRLIVVEDGRIEAIGTPARLQANSHFYRTVLAISGPA